MRKLYVLFALIGLMLQSCVLKEEMHLSKQGKVDYVYDFDFSDLLKSMPMKDAESEKMLKAFKAKNGKKISLKEFLEITLSAEKGGKVNKDSIMEANKELLSKAKNIFVRATMTEKVGKVEFLIKAKNLEEFNQSLTVFDSFITNLNKLDSKKEEGDKAFEFLLPSHYSLEENVFKRIVEGKEVRKENDSVANDPFGGMGAFFAYKMKVSFDNKIKSVSYEDAVISKDKKAFEVEFSMLDISKNPKLLEYTVEFEK